MEKTDKKLYFVGSAMGAPDYLVVYGIDVRDGNMMLSEKMAKGRGFATPLVGEIPVNKVTLAGEKLCFVGRDSAIECSLVAAFTMRDEAERCYHSNELRSVDTRWQTQTAEVLAFFERPSAGECHFGPALMATT